MSLTSRLPRDSCIRTTHEQRFGEDWTVERELTALLIEVTSVAASGRQLRKPIQIPRPPNVKAKGKATELRNAYAKGIAVLARTAKSVSRG